MASELKGKGLELVMIDFRENPELVRRTVKQRGYTGRVRSTKAVTPPGACMGCSVRHGDFVDRQGNLVGRLVGARDWEAPAARKFVEELLEMK